MSMKQRTDWLLIRAGFVTFTSFDAAALAQRGWRMPALALQQLCARMCSALAREVGG